jgi:hypothetical protein
LPNCTRHLAEDLANKTKETSHILKMPAFEELQMLLFRKLLQPLLLFLLVLVSVEGDGSVGRLAYFLKRSDNGRKVVD